MYTPIGAVTHIIRARVIIGATDRRAAAKPGLVTPVIGRTRVPIIAGDPDGDGGVLTRARSGLTGHAAAARFIFHASHDRRRVDLALTCDTGQRPVAQVAIVQRITVGVDRAGAIDWIARGADTKGAHIVLRAQLIEVARITVNERRVIARRREARVQGAVIPVIAQRLRDADALLTGSLNRARVTVITGGTIR